jgi:hypothetical protein
MRGRLLVMLSSQSNSTEGVPEPNLRQKETEAVDVESSFEPFRDFLVLVPLGRSEAIIPLLY